MQARRVRYWLGAIWCIGVLAATVVGANADLSAPTVELQLRIPREDVEELRRQVKQFAQAEGFVVKDLGASLPLSAPRDVTILELARANAMRVFVADFQEEGHFFIWIENLQSDPEFGQIARRLEAAFQAKWPGRVIRSSVAAATPNDSKQPRIRLELRIAIDESGSLLDLLQQFAQTEGFVVRISGREWRLETGDNQSP